MTKRAYLMEGLNSLPSEVKKQLCGLIDAHMTARKDLPAPELWKQMKEALEQEAKPARIKTLYVIFDTKENKLLTKRSESRRFKDSRFYKMRHVAERYIQVNLGGDVERYKVCELNIHSLEDL